MPKRALNPGSTLRALLVVAIPGLTACGGSQQPAESPEAVPSAAPSAAPAPQGAAEGEHTMPDGTKMEGDEHGEGSSEHQH